MPRNVEPNDNAKLKWKRKTYFDGTECGYSGCTKPAKGYVSGTKPTKGGKGALWFGPACDTCDPNVKPISLAELARQRNGASDLALVLDIEVGDVHKRLAALGIDDRGNALPPANGGVALPATEDGIYIQAEPIFVPVRDLDAKLAWLDQTLAWAATVHISNQIEMDQIGAFLVQVKGFIDNAEKARVAAVQPWENKAKEVSAFYNKVVNPAKRLEKVLKQKIDEGKQRADLAAQAAYLAAQAAHQQGNMAGVAMATQAAAAADVVLPQGIHVRPKIRWEIIDPNGVRSDLWSWVVDPAKVEAAIAAGDYNLGPGIRVWEENTVYAPKG
jgi:hypothetical protein